MDYSFNRGSQLPGEKMYAPTLRDHWLASRVSEDGTRPSTMIGEAITRALGGKNGTIYRFGVPNAGFEVDVRFLNTIGPYGSQLVFMLRQDVKSQEEFDKLQRTVDPLTRGPYISPKAHFEGEGKYPVGAFISTKNNRNADEENKWLNPYDYVDNPNNLPFRDKKTGDTQATVELFGLPKDQGGVAHGQVRADFQQDFPDVRGRGGLSNVFGKILNGGQQQQRPQYPQQQQQYPGQYQQQRPTNCDGPGALDGAVGSNGRGVQVNVGKVLSNVFAPKPRGCE